MAERYSFSSTRNESSAPNWMLDELLAPGSGYGWARDEGRSRGQVKSTFIDPLGMIQRGDSKYGLSSWDTLFDDRGYISDTNALLRALNAGNVFAAEGSRGFGGSGGNIKYGLGANQQFGDWTSGLMGGGGNAPNSGNLDYFTDDFLASRGWQDGIDPGAFFGEDFGKKYERQTGKSPFKSDLEEWLFESSFRGKERGSRWGRERQDVAGYWYDPSRIRFREEDLAGIQTQEDLDRWAMDNYGVDAQMLAAMSDELLNTRQQFAADPSLWWNDGALDITGDIAGLNNVDVQARLGDIIQQYQGRQIAEQNDLTARMLESATLASGDPMLGRTNYGAALAQLYPELIGAPSQVASYQQPGVGFDYGLANALRPYLEDQLLSQARYGG